jgi:hypothetical protein
MYSYLFFIINANKLFQFSSCSDYNMDIRQRNSPVGRYSIINNASVA